VFTKDSRIVVYGRAGMDRHGRELVLENPEYERLDPDDDTGDSHRPHRSGLQKLGGLPSRALRAAMHGVLETLREGDLADPVPDDVRTSRGLPPHLDAVRDTHFPPRSASMLELAERRSPAQRALAFEEIFLVQLAWHSGGGMWRRPGAVPITRSPTCFASSWRSCSPSS
jgi:RecG-like helicase